MNYSINNFFEKEECKSIIEFAENNGIPFSYNPAEFWDCKRIYDEDFKLKIKNKFLKLYNNGDFKLWFNLNVPAVATPTNAEFTYSIKVMVAMLPSPIE